MDDIIKIKSLLRNFSYVNPIWEKEILLNRILIFEIACTDKRINVQFECSKEDLSELIKQLKLLIFKFDDMSNYEKAVVYLYDSQLFSIETMN